MRIASGLTALLVTAGMTGIVGSVVAERRDMARTVEPASVTAAAPRGGAAARDSAAGGGRDSAAGGGESKLAAPPRARLEPYLEASEITAEVRPYSPSIERCYLARLGESRRAGKLDLTMLIGRDGSVVSVTVAADGLSARAARKASACIREATAALRFPARRNDTTAVVPYYFQRTEAPGAGPQLSCWNPRGC